MDDRYRLKWIQRNRARHGTMERVGASIARLAANLSTGERMIEDRLVEELAGVVDGEFMRHCRIDGIKGHILVINVDEPSLVYPIRMKWAGPLTGRLAADGQRTSIHGLRFQIGNAGRPIGPTPD